MFKDVGQTGIVHRVRQEGQVIDAVGVVVGDIDKARAGFLVLKPDHLRADDREFADFLGGKAVNGFADFGQADFFSLFRRLNRGRGRFADGFFRRRGDRLAGHAGHRKPGEHHAQREHQSKKLIHLFLSFPANRPLSIRSAAYADNGPILP